LVLVTALSAIAGALPVGVQAASPPERKIIDKIAPAYPPLARRTNIRGVVKLEVVVRPNGTVKSTRVLGGNPVLIDSAKDAVQQWKFEAGPQETTEIEQIRFEPK
jgi:TonB family protein